MSETLKGMGDCPHEDDDDRESVSTNVEHMNYSGDSKDTCSECRIRKLNPGPRRLIRLSHPPTASPWNISNWQRGNSCGWVTPEQFQAFSLSWHALESGEQSSQQLRWGSGGNSRVWRTNSLKSERWFSVAWGISATWAKHWVQLIYWEYTLNPVFKGYWARCWKTHLKR